MQINRPQWSAHMYKLMTVYTVVYSTKQQNSSDNLPARQSSQLRNCRLPGSGTIFQSWQRCNWIINLQLTAFAFSFSRNCSGSSVLLRLCIRDNNTMTTEQVTLDAALSKCIPLPSWHSHNNGTYNHSDVYVYKRRRTLRCWRKLGAATVLTANSQMDRDRWPAHDR